MNAHDNDQTDVGLRVFARERKDDITAREAQAFLNWYYAEMLKGAKDTSHKPHRKDDISAWLVEGKKP